MILTCVDALRLYVHENMPFHPPSATREKMFLTPRPPPPDFWISRRQQHRSLGDVHRPVAGDPLPKKLIAVSARIMLATTSTWSREEENASQSTRIITRNRYRY